MKITIQFDSGESIYIKNANHKIKSTLEDDLREYLRGNCPATNLITSDLNMIIIWSKVEAIINDDRNS